jgi:hypothetical protein
MLFFARMPGHFHASCGALRTVFGMFCGVRQPVLIVAGIICAAFRISRTLFESTARCAFSRTVPTVGITIAARMPMIAMTVSSSIRVNAAALERGAARREP